MHDMERFLKDFRKFIKDFRAFIASLADVVPPPAYDTDPKELAMNKPDPLPPPFLAPVTTAPPKYLWDTPAEARHSIRVIGDEERLTWKEKDLICAVIEGESGFDNDAKNANRNARGEVTSTDWGICQINDTPGWHIGPGLAFPSVDFVVRNPDRAVRFMIRMYKAGRLSLWTAYKNGRYKRFLQ